MAELTPEERQRIYEEEKARFEAQAELKKEQREKTTSRWLIGCASIIGIVIVLIAIGSMASNTATNTTATPETPLTDTEKIQRGCRVIKFTLGDKPISELSMEDLQKIQLCQTLGYYK